MGHTKGPWYANTSGNQPLIYTEETGKAIAVCYDVNWDETKANANLIAAAPELLATCKCALADLEGIMPKFEPSGDRQHPAWATIRELQTAINESEGR